MYSWTLVLHSTRYLGQLCRLRQEDHDHFKATTAAFITRRPRWLASPKSPTGRNTRYSYKKNGSGSCSLVFRGFTFAS